MIVATVKMFPAHEKHQELLSILFSIQEPVLAEGGCLSCSIYEGSGEARCIFYVEQWQSMKELERHLRSNNYGKVLEAMELSAQVPETFFYETCEPAGFDLVEKARLPALHK